MVKRTEDTAVAPTGIGISKGWIAVIVIAAIALFSLLWIMGTYNGLVAKDTNTEQKWANVQSAYQRRADLIPNLVAVAKQYSNYEGDVLVQVTQARASVGGARTPAELEKAGTQLDSALSRLLVVFENYPELQADKNYLALQDQLEGTENRINMERNYYNDAVKSYKTSVRTFPTNVVAGFTGFTADKWQPFQAQEGAQNAPNVTQVFQQNARTSVASD